MQQTCTNMYTYYLIDTKRFEIMKLIYSLVSSVVGNSIFLIRCLVCIIFITNVTT